MWADLRARLRRAKAVAPLLACALAAGCAMPLSNDGDRVTVRHDPEVEMQRVYAIATEQCAQAGRSAPTLKHTAVLNTWLPEAMVPKVSTFDCGPRR